MMLTHELIGFFGQKTRGAREEKEDSCVKWKYKFCEVPSPSKKSHSAHMKFVEWLFQKEINTVVDFEKNIETRCQVSSDGICVKEQFENRETIFKENGKMHGQKVCEITEERVESVWKKTIVEMRPSGIFINCGTFHVRDDNTQLD